MVASGRADAGSGGNRVAGDDRERPGGRWIGSAEAARRLGVKPETLYAYVSRGLLRRERSGDGRRSHYDAAEVERLARHGRRGAQPTPPELVIETAIAAIDGGRLLYRGLEATALAADRRFEEVAHWLWTGRFAPPSPWRAEAAAVAVGRAAQAALPDGTLPLERLRVIAAALATTDELRFELDPPAVVAAAQSLIAGLVACLPDATPTAPHATAPHATAPPSEPASSWIAARLWAKLAPAPAEPTLLRVLDAALVLLADHELAASTVAARIAASVRADPYAVVSTGLATASGALHAGASLHIETLLAEVRRADRAATVVGEWLRRGERIRGFGHALYQVEDPRGRFLLERLREAAAGSERLAAAEAVIAAARRRRLPAPNVDFALAALSSVAGMTRGAAEAVFVIGRTAGWLAHALEEYRRGTPIRPRAVYTGPSGPTA
jgi:citrate synthase